MVNNLFKKILIPLLWKIEKIVKILITFSSFPIKISLNGLLTIAFKGMFVWR